MIPATGSPDWQRRVLHQQADTLASQQRFHEEQARWFPFMASIQLECAQECIYLIFVLRAMADNVRPPARGLDLAPVVAALHDGEGRAE